MIDRKIFSERLRNLRNRDNKTMVDVSTALRISKVSVFQWESMKTIPTGDNLIVLADYFDVSVDYLVGRSDSLQRK